MGVYRVKKGDRDCSASVIDALKTAGIPVGNATYTGNIKSEFVKTGKWAVKPMSYTAHRGDLYLREGHHVAMCSYPERGKTTPDKLLEFSHNESGGYYNGKVGDQLNNSGYAGESHERSYYSYPWDCILTYTGTRTDLLEDAVQIMEHLVRCPEHGYTMSSPGRNGSTGYCTVETTGTATGWVKDDNGWKYKSSGSFVKNCWKSIKGVWYYFGKNEYAYNNAWFKYKDNWYRFDKDCKMVKGWVKLNDVWFYLNPAKTDKYPEGAMVTGWIKLKGLWYYLRPEKSEAGVEGSMVTGWLEDDGKKYYLYPEKVGDHPEGSMAVGTIKIEGISYTFDDKGALKEDKKGVYYSINEIYLNVRSGPGMNYPVVTTKRTKQMVEVEEVKPGTGSKNGWGKIPEGWISLDYCTKQ